MRHFIAVLAFAILAAAPPPKSRLDPYRNYRFRVSLGGAYVAGFSDFSNLLPSMNAAAAGVPNSGSGNGNLVGGNNLGGGISGNAAGGGPGGNLVSGNMVGRNGSVPVQAPGSLVGRPGTVTLICSVAPNSATPGTLTLVCSVPPIGGQGGGIAGQNASGSGGVNPNVSKLPVRTKYDAITLRRGVTQDPGFQSWVSSVRSGPPRDVVVDVFNEAGQRTGEYRLRGCTVATFQGMPTLAGGANAVSVGALELHCESAQGQ